MAKWEPNGSDFDLLIEDEKELKAGTISFFAIPTPGHTPACTSFFIGNNVFCGDALFMPYHVTAKWTGLTMPKPEK